METKLDATSKLLVSSGGVFEIEYDGKLIYSKKKTGRFPEPGEVLKVVFGLEQGLSLEDAQQEAGKNAAPLPSFVEWLSAKFTRRKA